ncbi:bifunctional hydroxymethylpyrimidine kinase/phosphomethylpyrimidine kinase [Pyxidicoccus parkwayensis]|jgi:sugar/nucleoside kinase (ribokinase family)|uniref:Bifunctional hydroxymethylpyrimidine kinase/phosphomethylpyrimidine kinase n=1 Tax=Pyxidicoccus parkwayensis TaxID=2813578 RepID=A0ABX7P773_9BACT|nr:PfkB family carbohydrate kinase [Pyxidicoccus parkwaysis]QSQ26247.1 bifunctional hydroxymethylpyrimidine kinase/phosphomethylpyrimidine kinase [Pyxidicoccus parkwaysis]
MSLLVVGSVALDSVETPFGRKEDILGGSATYFSTSASFFTPARVVAVVGEDFPEAHLNFLRGRGIDLEGLTRESGRTFRWKGRYGYELNEAQTLDTQLNVFQAFSPKLPESYRDTPYVFLGNIHPELQAQVLDQVRAPKLVAADTMNFWINGSRQALLKTLKRVNLLFVNDAEARQLAGEHNVVKAARSILSMGPQRVVIKRGEYGALLFDHDHIFACPAFPLAEVFDPTGAGDTFAGGFMGALATSAGGPDAAVLRRAMVMGSVMASFTVEKFSLERLREVTRPEIHARFAEFRTLTHFDDLGPLER